MADVEHHLDGSEPRETVETGCSFVAFLTNVCLLSMFATYAHYLHIIQTSRIFSAAMFFGIALNL